LIQRYQIKSGNELGYFCASKYLSMLRPADNYFLQNEEPFKSCLQSLREYILQLNDSITEKWMYGMPFYYYKGKRFCYLWIHKKYLKPYIGIVDGKWIYHPELLSEKRTRMKILLIDPGKNLPVKKIRAILREVLAQYK
jgi:uncharacterized protein DUF1801